MLDLLLTFIAYVGDMKDTRARELREEIQHVVDETKHTKTTFLDAESLDRAVDRAIIDLESHEGVANPAGEADEGHQQQTAATPLALGSLECEHDSNHMFHYSDSIEDSISALVHHGHFSRTQPPAMSESHMVQALSDDEFINIAEHLSI
jgi:hypothetical protein